MSLPEWAEVHKEFAGQTRLERQLVGALAIAWDAMQKAMWWHDVRGLSAEAAFRESYNDLQAAMRQIEEYGK